MTISKQALEAAVTALVQFPVLSARATKVHARAAIEAALPLLGVMRDDLTDCITEVLCAKARSAHLYGNGGRDLSAGQIADIANEIADALPAQSGSEVHRLPTEAEIAEALAEHINVSDETLKAAGGAACIDGIGDAAKAVLALFSVGSGVGRQPVEGTLIKVLPRVRASLDRMSAGSAVEIQWIDEALSPAPASPQPREDDKL